MTKAIFITGAASGMGRAAATLFADRGWFVGGYDLNEEGLASLRAELGDNHCVTGLLDVTDKDGFDSAVADFGAASGGRMDILFNNAGIGESGWFEDVPHDRAMRLVDINLKGVLNGAYSGLELLKATPGSLLFNNASSSATYGMPRLAVYSATKHGVKGLTEALAIEWGRHDIRVSDALPGLINTPLLQNTPNHSGDGAPRPTDQAPKSGPFRLIEPVEVAEALWACYHAPKPKLHWYVPKGIGMIDKMKAISADFVRRRIEKMLPG